MSEGKLEATTKKPFSMMEPKTMQKPEIQLSKHLHWSGFSWCNIKPTELFFSMYKNFKNSLVNSNRSCA